MNRKELDSNNLLFNPREFAQNKSRIHPFPPSSYLSVEVISRSNCTSYNSEMDKKEHFYPGECYLRFFSTSFKV